MNKSTAKVIRDMQGRLFYAVPLTDSNMILIRLMGEPDFVQLPPVPVEQVNSDYEIILEESL